MIDKLSPIAKVVLGFKMIRVEGFPDEIERSDQVCFDTRILSNRKIEVRNDRTIPSDKPETGFAERKQTAGFWLGLDGTPFP